MSKASLQQWLARLETIHPREVELGLERVATVAAALGLLVPEQPVVTVAGTNGKGSTVAVLEALLHETGQCTGVFTSPHFLRFNERIRVAGIEVSDEEIIAAFDAIDGIRGDISLTYFEFSTLAALQVFRARAVDIIILEVGLGGRLDAVNIVDPSVAVITSIDLDHQDWLGESRAEIAREKAGILRRGTPVVIADPSPPQELLDSVSEAGASPAYYFGEDFSVEESPGEWRGLLRQLDGQTRSLQPRPMGSLLPQNICAAAQAATVLGIEFSDEQLSRALQGYVTIGRRQSLRQGGLDYLLDVAHNPSAIDKLVEYMSITHCKGKNIAVFSIMSDKDIEGVLAKAAGHFDGWFLGDQPALERAASAADLASILYGLGENMVSVSKNVRQAFRRGQRVAGPGDRLVVFGSFHTVAEVLPLLEKDQNKYGVN